MIERFNAVRGDIIPSNAIDESTPVVEVVLASDYDTLERDRDNLRDLLRGIAINIAKAVKE